MKKWIILLLFQSFISCKNKSPDDSESTKAAQSAVKVEKLVVDDTTTLITNWEDSIHGIMYTMVKQDRWESPEKIKSKHNYITISKKYMNRYCKLRCITVKLNAKTKQEDVSGFDIYFKLDNLINRDINKSLLAPNIW